MLLFLQHTLDLLDVAIRYPISVAIRGKVKAREQRAREIDRILGIR